MLGFMVAASAAGMAFLRKGDRKWDIVGMASVEISLVFFFIAIVSGSIWAVACVGHLVDLGTAPDYRHHRRAGLRGLLLLRQGIEDPDRRARFGAVYAILAFISVPITFISIRIARTIHPVIIGSGSAAAEGSFEMTPRMLQAFMFSLITFSFIFADLLWHRIRLGRLAEKVENLKLKDSNKKGDPMLTSILQGAPAQTTNYMIAGYVVIFGIMFLYIVSIFIRRRNLMRDLEILNEMEAKER